MKALFDLFPLLVFFAAFKLYGIFAATAASIVASFVQVGIGWWRHRRWEKVQLITLAVVAVFGGLTLFFHDDTFIKWKLTIVDWIFSALILGSQWIGNRTIIERLLGEQIVLPGRVWRLLNLSWGIFFLVLGALNLYVAFFYGIGLDAETRQKIWVNFKVFGSTALMVMFSVVQAVVIANYLSRNEKDKP